MRITRRTSHQTLLDDEVIQPVVQKSGQAEGQAAKPFLREEFRYGEPYLSVLPNFV